MDIDVSFKDKKIITNWRDYISDDFKTEKEMCNYIQSHSEEFAKDILGIEIIGCEREYYLGQRIRRGNRPHVDFMFRSKENDIIIVECKNVNNIFSELSGAISQLLSYYIIAEDNRINIKRMCLVVNKFDDRLRKVIEKFNLPIELFVFSKTNTLKLLLNDKN